MDKGKMCDQLICLNLKLARSSSIHIRSFPSAVILHLLVVVRYLLSLSDTISLKKRRRKMHTHCRIWKHHWDMPDHFL
ncbi:hypothetical protein F8388_010119 [Cannabis sativa]|uniref:Uncharacterized protein n=1 Tax=Cannabis sativa TaxID=3483 RepID=A0A7J6GRK7_CANSA|nr:hypothetical protein F8388_010119 [Cannabis sativa]